MPRYKVKLRDIFSPAEYINASSIEEAGEVLRRKGRAYSSIERVKEGEYLLLMKVLKTGEYSIAGNGQTMTYEQVKKFEWAQSQSNVVEYKIVELPINHNN